jgi:hypothetical protein
MGPITESRITEIVLLFLRERYKYYPLRSGNIEFKTNLRGKGHLFVDGALSFTRHGATDFLASIEATDFLKRDELWYRFLWQLALWDALAASMGALSAIFAYMHYSDHLGPFKGNPWLLSGVGSLLLAATTCLVFLAIRPLRRYRYIYAIEQFKRYRATEQWVAFAWDVFPGYTVPVFTELREQCVLNGLGLLEINRDGKVKLHLSPAREGMPEQQKRQVVQLFSQLEWPKSFQSQIEGNAWRRAIGKVLEKLTGRKAVNDLLRFERPVSGQIRLIVGSVAFTIFLLVKEYGKRPVIYVREERYERQMLALGNTLAQYPYDNFMPDTLDRVAVFKFNREALPYLKLVPDSLPDWNRVRSGWMLLDGDKMRRMDCTEVYSQVQGRFVVTAGVFNDMGYLHATMIRLKSAGIRVHAVWGACLFERKHYYILLLPETFDGAEAAQRASVRINDLLISNGFSNLNASYAGVE